MKLLACSKCHGVVPLVQKRIKSCKCRNIKGKYTDKRNILVIVKDKKKSRIIMFPNWVRYGWKKRGRARVISWDNKNVTIK